MNVNVLTVVTVTMCHKNLLEFRDLYLASYFSASQVDTAKTNKQTKNAGYYDFSVFHSDNVTKSIHHMW